VLWWRSWQRSSGYGVARVSERERETARRHGRETMARGGSEHERETAARGREKAARGELGESVTRVEERRWRRRIEEEDEKN
jgi:hypothetical protein